MKKIKIIAALSVLLTGCGGGGGSDEGSPANGRSYVHSYSEEVGQCTQFSYTSEELEASSVVTAGECPTSGRIAYCDLSAVLENVNEMRIFYYQGSPFTVAENEQGCNHLGGQYVIGTGAGGEEPSDGEQVELLTVNETATEYQNYLINFTNHYLGEAWNIKEKKVEKFVNTEGTYQKYVYSEGVNNQKVTVFKEQDEGEGKPMFSFNHSTGAYEQLSSKIWKDDEYCIDFFQNGIIAVERSTDIYYCNNAALNEEHLNNEGFFINPYLNGEDSVIAIDFAKDAFRGDVKAIFNLDENIKGYVSNTSGVEHKVYLLENNEFISYDLRFTEDNNGTATPIKYISSNNIIMSFSGSYFKFTLDQIKAGEMGVEITSLLSDGDSISRVFFKRSPDEDFLVSITQGSNGSSYTHNYIPLNELNSFEIKASVQTEGFSSLVSLPGFYVIAVYDDQPSVAEFNYYAKSDWVLDGSKHFSSNIGSNGGACISQGEGLFAVIDDSIVSFVDDNGLIQQTENKHLFTLNNASESIYNGSNTNKFLTIDYTTGIVEKFNELNQTWQSIGDLNVQGSAVDETGCRYGHGYYSGDSFVMSSSDELIGSFYGSLTGGVDSI